MNLSLCTLKIIMLATLASASEIDSFTKRYEPLPDSSAAIDAMAAKSLEKAVAKANEKNRCSERILMKSLREHFQIILWDGKFMEELMASNLVVKRATPRTESIYKYHTKKDGMLLVRPAADKDGIGMGAMMQYKDLYIGTDKIEHLFGRGYIYFYEHYINKLPILNILEKSAQEERLLLGGNRFETGIFSYADLVANFNGIRFWNDILKKYPDLLGRELAPVIKCEGKKWVINRPIHFADYIDDGVDESLNCIQTATENGAKGILRAISELQIADPQHEYRCPMGTERIPALKAKYGNYSPWLFNFDGIKKFEYNFPIAPDRNVLVGGP